MVNAKTALKGNFYLKADDFCRINGRECRLFLILRVNFKKREERENVNEYSFDFFMWAGFGGCF